MTDIDARLRDALRDAARYGPCSAKVAADLRPRMARARTRRRRTIAGSTAAAVLLGLPAAALTLVDSEGRTPVNVVADTTGTAPRDQVPPTSPDADATSESGEHEPGPGEPTSGGVRHAPSTNDTPSHSGDSTTTRDGPRTGEPAATERTTSPSGSPAGSEPAATAPDNPAPTIPPPTPAPTAPQTQPTGPGATQAPTTSAPPVAPSTRTLSSSCGSIVIRVSGDQTTLVSSHPAAGYDVDVKNAGPEEVEVGLEGPGGHCELKAEVENGRLETEIDTD